LNVENLRAVEERWASFRAARKSLGASAGSDEDRMFTQERRTIFERKQLSEVTDLVQLNFF